MLRLGPGVAVLASSAPSVPAGRPSTPASAPSRPMMLASPARIVSTATANPQASPASAPNAFIRFHQIDSTSTGKSVEPVSASDQSNSRNGSVGASKRDGAADHRDGDDGERAPPPAGPRAAAAPTTCR